jgi:hypothetical protein
MSRVLRVIASWRATVDPVHQTSHVGLRHV